MRKGKKLLPVICLTVLLFSGCTNSSGYAEKINDLDDEAVLRSAGVKLDDDYGSYLKMVKNGELDEEGYYLTYEGGQAVPVMAGTETTAPEPEHDETIHITFAENNFIDVKFYTVKGEEKIPVEGGECWLNPGEAVYADKPSVRRQEYSLYKFGGFRVRQCDDYSSGGVPAFRADGEGYLLSIPEDFDGTELSVIPLGEYEPRIVDCEAYRINEDGTHQAISDKSGSWFINGGRFYSNTSENKISAGIDPTAEYTVEFDYDENEYYIDKDNTSPKDFEDENGVLTFGTKKPSEETVSCTVALRKFSTIVFDEKNTGGILGITVNGTEREVGKTVTKLKINDNVTIEVKEGYEAYCAECLLQPESVSGGTRYTLIMPDKNKVNITVQKKSGSGSVNEVNLENFEGCTVQLFKTDIEQPTEITGSADDSDKVKVVIKPLEGYKIVGRNVNENGDYEKIMKYSVYKETIDDIIGEQLKKLMTVTLPASDEYGVFGYELDGKPVNAGKVTVYEGQKIKCTYTVSDTDNYKIDKNAILGFFNDKTAGGTVTVTADMNGKVFSRDDFGITVVKRED